MGFHASRLSGISSHRGIRLSNIAWTDGAANFSLPDSPVRIGPGAFPFIPSRFLRPSTHIKPNGSSGSRLFCDLSAVFYRSIVKSFRSGEPPKHRFCLEKTDLEGRPGVSFRNSRKLTEHLLSLDTNLTTHSRLEVSSGPNQYFRQRADSPGEMLHDSE